MEWLYIITIIFHAGLIQQNKKRKSYIYSLVVQYIGKFIVNLTNKTTILKDKGGGENEERIYR